MIHRLMSAILSLVGYAEKQRSSRWPKIRAEHLAQFPTCAACGTNKHLEVHHLHPFSQYPELELEPTNLLTLCESPSHNCHLIFGHLLLWESWNPFAELDAQSYRDKVKHRPRPKEKV